MGLDLAIILFLIVVNGFFVAAEFAIVKVRSSQVEADIAAGSRVAKTAKVMINRLDIYLSVAQVGITLASLALGWLGEPVVAKMLVAGAAVLGLSISPELTHTIAVPLGFILITLAHMILGEVIPKCIAITYPQQVTYLTAVPLKLSGAIFIPLVWVVNSIARALLKPFGVDVTNEQDTHTEEELRMLLAESARSSDIGSIRQTEHDLIEKVFHFDERLVREIMVPRTKMVGVHIESSPDEIFDTLVRESYSRMPVYSDSRDNIVGIVHSKDLLRLLKEKKAIHLKELMRPAYFVPETKKIAELLRELQQRRSHMAIVVDEYGITSGLVTLEDIVEELVGEIQDEYDEEVPVVERKSDSAFIVNAHAPLIDVNKSLPVPLPEGSDYSTVAGLINVVFSYIPEVGQTKSFGRYQVTILRRSKRSVDSALLELMPEASGEEESEREEEAA